MSRRKIIWLLLIAALCGMYAWMIFKPSGKKELTKIKNEFTSEAMLFMYGQSMLDSCEAPVIKDSAGIKTVYFRCHLDPVYDPIKDSNHLKLATLSRSVVIRELVYKKKPVVDKVAFTFIGHGQERCYINNINDFDTTLCDISTALNFYFASMAMSCKTQYVEDSAGRHLSLNLFHPLYFGELRGKRFARTSNARAVFIRHAILKDSASYFTSMLLLNHFIGNNPPVLKRYPMNAPIFTQYEYNYK